MKKKILLIFVAAALAGCAPVISQKALKNVDRSVTLDAVQANPDAFQGRKVVWGGIIIRTQNLEKTTEIEVLETEISSYTYLPKDGTSKGRFLIESPTFLDAAIFEEGLRITVAGVIKGVKYKKIGKMNYPYAVVTPIEMKLSEPPPTYEEMPPWYGPYGPYGPYWPYYPWPPPPGYPFWPGPWYPWPPPPPP